MPDKPSSNESEYFHKLEREKLDKRRQAAAARKAAEDRDARRRLHHMHCPRCGADLAEETYHGVKVDRCTECRGVWFDAGEVESLVDKDGGAIQHFFGDLFKGFGGGGKHS